MTTVRVAYSSYKDLPRFVPPGALPEIIPMRVTEPVEGGVHWCDLCGEMHEGPCPWVYIEAKHGGLT